MNIGEESTPMSKRKGEAKGYTPDECSLWISDKNNVLLWYCSPNRVPSDLRDLRVSYIQRMKLHMMIFAFPVDHS